MDGLALYFRKAFFWLQSKGGEMRGRDNNQDTITIVQMRHKEALNKGSSIRNKKEGRESRRRERSLSYEEMSGWVRQ